MKRWKDETIRVECEREEEREEATNEALAGRLVTDAAEAVYTHRPCSPSSEETAGLQPLHPSLPLSSPLRIETKSIIRICFSLSSCVSGQCQCHSVWLVNAEGRLQPPHCCRLQRAVRRAACGGDAA